jgi:hypothetical protein
MADRQKRAKPDYKQRIDDLIPFEFFISWVCTDIAHYYRNRIPFVMAFTNTPGKKTFIMRGDDNYTIKLSVITKSYEISQNSLVPGKVVKDLGCLFSEPTNLEETISTFFHNITRTHITSVRKTLIFDRFTRLRYLKAHRGNVSSEEDESGSNNLYIFYNILDRIIDPSLTRSIASNWLEGLTDPKFSSKTAIRHSIYLDLEFATITIMSKDQDNIRALYRQKIAQADLVRNK